MCENQNRQAGVLVTDSEFVRAVSAALTDRFQISSIDGLELPECEAQAIARCSWMLLLENLALPHSEIELDNSAPEKSR